MGYEQERLAEQVRQTSRLYRRLTRGVPSVVAVGVFLATDFCGGGVLLALGLAAAAAVVAWVLTVLGWVVWLLSELD